MVLRIAQNQKEECKIETSRVLTNKEAWIDEWRLNVKMTTLKKLFYTAEKSNLGQSFQKIEMESAERT